MVAFLSELNGLDLWATNIGNAYLEAKTSELLFIVAGPEFGDLEGHMLVIYKALYGLRSSGLHWHERFSACLQDMGFLPCKAEPDIWIKRVDNHYEYIATYVDDLAVSSKDPKAITDILMNKYNFKLKGTGEIEYHLGMSFRRNDRNELWLHLTPTVHREDGRQLQATLWQISFAPFTITFGIKRSSRNRLLQVSR
jgi:hypothetical protein